MIRFQKQIAGLMLVLTVNASIGSTVVSAQTPVTPHNRAWSETAHSGGRSRRGLGPDRQSFAKKHNRYGP